MSNRRNTETQNLAQNSARGNSVSYELFILAITIFALIVASIIILWPLKPTTKAVLLRVDLVISIVFVVDFLIVFWRAPNKTGYFFVGGGWLDLVGCVPTIPDLPWTAILRFARSSRAIRIVTHLRSRDRGDVIREARKNRAQSALLATFLVAIVLITVASLFVLQVERGMPDATIKTGTDAFWWAFVTMTTVGYGDYVPVTLSGRIMAMVLMTFGVGIFAVLTGFLASKLLAHQEDYQESDQDIRAIVREEMAQLRQENSAMRSELSELTTMLKNPESEKDDSA